MGARVPILCRNSDAHVDPLRYQCDIGRVADSLLLFDQVTIVSEEFAELVTLVHWLGEAQTLQLINDGSLRFILSQMAPQPLFQEERLRLFRMAGGNGHFKDERDPTFRSNEDLEYYLDHMFRNGQYLPEGWTFSSALIDAIVAATSIMPKSFSDECAEFVEQVLMEPCLLQQIDKSFKERWGEDSRLSGRLGKDAEQAYYFTQPSPRDRAYFSGLVQGAYEVAVSTAAVGNNVSSWLGECVLRTSVSQYQQSIGSREELMATIYRIEDLPRIENAVFLEEIPAVEVLRLRRASAARRFRSWMSAASKTYEGDLVKGYMKEVSALAGHDSLLFSAFRLVGVSAIGAFDPGIGTGMGVADWLLEKLRARAKWNPKVFVDEALSQSLSQQSAPKRIRIPVDPRTLLRSDWRVSRFTTTRAGSKLQLQRGASETFNIEYGTDGRDLAVLNKRIDDLMRAADCELHFECSGCQRINRVPGGRQLRNIRCSACRAPLVPILLVGT